MSEEILTSVKIPSFDGEEENFQVWWTRFQAFARVKWLEKALKIDTDLPGTQAELDALDPKSNAAKPGVRAGLRNDTAVAQLTMPFQIAGLLDKVNQTKTTDWPDGLADNLLIDFQE